MPTRSRSEIDRFPLSSMQLGMLFHYLSEQERGVDVEQIVCDLAEPVDTARLEQAWARVAGRHPAFRTGFRWDGLPQPEQYVVSETVVPFETHDWTGRESTAEDFESFLDSDRARGFDLSAPPLFRLNLFTLGASEHRLVWTFHHILQDGRSFPILLDEVFSAYDALTAGKNPPELPAPPEFKRFVEWQRNREGRGDAAFWKEALAGFDEPTALPGARDSAAEGEDAGRGEVVLTLSREETDALRETAKAQGFTLNTCVQGAWSYLLHRYSGNRDVLFGAIRACRKASVDGADDMVGVFINTVPVRARIDDSQPLTEWLSSIRQSQLAVREHEHTPLVNIQQSSGLPPGTPLFHSILVFDAEHLSTHLRKKGKSWENRRFELYEKTGFPLTLYGYGEECLKLKLAYEKPRFSDEAAGGIVRHLGNLLREMGQKPGVALGELQMLDGDERDRLLVEWNDTACDVAEAGDCVHRLIERRAAAQPDAPAIAYRDLLWTYGELNARANRLARELRKRGVARESLVGIHIARGPEVVVAALAIHKAGGAYVPLDPELPRERVALMVDDANIRSVVTDSEMRGNLPDDADAVLVDRDAPEIGRHEDTNLDVDESPDQLAYVIYTSGSTGKPKGVMVEHRNVVNFFRGMDDRLDHRRNGVWLAVTGLSFDISVLELFWTLSRGFKVVLQDSETKVEAGEAAAPRVSRRPIDFSLFYFASDEGGQGREKYKVLLEGARFADKNGFTAIWTPERHFHAFGGLYPNPSVAGAAIAAITDHVEIRSGSVVSPLHHPIRIAEEWALVDNLSGGRVGISFASGWQPNDFVLAPQNYEDRKTNMMESIETVRRLWRGEKLPFKNGKGQTVEVSTLPRPVQKELPVWITTAGNVETYELAGKAGANVLTHLLGQTVEELGDKIAAYRAAHRKSGKATGPGKVTLMLHTFVGEDDESVKEIVRGPMKAYLGSSISLVKNFADTWTAFSRKAKDAVRPSGDELANLSPEDMEALLEHSFERYFETSGLFGSVDTCLAMVEKLKRVGVDEIACLIDFGVPSEKVLANFDYIRQVRDRSIPPAQDGDYSFAAQVARHGVTHLQCTPSLANMLIETAEAKEALGKLRKVMIGGEAFPTTLLEKLRPWVRGDVINMYGPTETTIWSATYQLNGDETSIPIGTPIANTDLYIVDDAMRPVPAGVAGELLIGGLGVTRGYFERTELTEERFIQHPFRPDGGRVYRTGDLARYRSDGVIEFLGRMDHQVKLRGHRVELGEIESVLGQMQEIREAVVVAREDTPGDKRLVAYVIAANGTEPSAAQLRERLRERLPEYMVPATFVPMQSFPLTPNGKIDRKMLPALDSIERQVGSAFVKPESDMEARIATVWSEVLNIDKIGANDNFFDLGGHSLLTVQVQNRLNAELEQRLSITDLFRFPTVRALAEHLTHGPDDDGVTAAKDRAESRRKAMSRRRRMRKRA